MAEDTRIDLFDFALPGAASGWQVVNDGVMGGVSEGTFQITDRNTLAFVGTLSLENNGGFASVRNRSVSGSMNELVKCAEFCMSDGGLTLSEVGDRLNDTLLSALAAGGSHGYGKPGQAFRVLMGKTGSTAERSQTGKPEHGHEQPPTD